MIVEFAIDPKSILDWTSRESYSVMIQQFGIDTGRVFASHPKISKWKKAVYDEAALHGLKELDRARLEELIRAFTECKISRDFGRKPYDKNRSWVDCALDQDPDQSFHGIIAVEYQGDDDKIIKGKFYEIISNEKFANLSDKRVPRNATEMAASIKRFLQISNRIKFLDPYFTFRPQYLDTITEFIKISLDQVGGNSKPNFEIHCTDSCPNTPSEVEKLARKLPTGIKVTIHRWEIKSDGGERFHDRHIISDVGGVSFGSGLDRSDHSMGDETVIIKRVGVSVLNSLEKDFNLLAPTFNIGDPIVVIGKARS
jgi:hypothetical protein